MTFLCLFALLYLQVNSLACQGKYTGGDNYGEAGQRIYGSCHAYWRV